MKTIVYPIKPANATTENVDHPRQQLYLAPAACLRGDNNIIISSLTSKKKKKKTHNHGNLVMSQCVSNEFRLRPLQNAAALIHGRYANW